MIVLASPLGSYLRRERGWPEGRVLLWAAPMLVLALVVMGLPSFGLLFLPSALLALVAALGSLADRPVRR